MKYTIKSEIGPHTFYHQGAGVFGIQVASAACTENMGIAQATLNLLNKMQGADKMNLSIAVLP